MTPTLASQCRRVAHRHLLSQNDSVWIPEALLVTAFERYCVNSRTVARYGSSVPGPMENRRRQGKRHMAELNLGQSHSASPLWGLENLADLTQWQWKPPSSPDERYRQHKTETAEDDSPARSMLNWLFGTPAEPATTAMNINPPLAEYLGGVVEGTIDIPEAADRPSPTLIWDVKSTPSEVINTALDSFLRDSTSSETAEILPNFSKFCDSWKDTLAHGLFSDHAICTVLDGIPHGLSELPVHSQVSSEYVFNKASLNLLAATIIGLSSRGISDQNYLDCLAWDRVLQKISELRMNSIRIFTQAMSRIPDSYLSGVSAGILANLRVYLMASGCDMKRSSLVRQVNKMAEPLKKLDPTTHRQIFEDITQYVWTYRKSENPNYTQMRLSWLQVLARIPGVDESYLTRVCTVLEAGKTVKPLTRREICEMYLAKRRSSIKDMKLMHHKLQGMRGKADSDRYGLFSLALWETGQFDHIKDFCTFLYQLGREQDVMHLAKTFRDHIKSKATPLATLAIKGGQPMLATDILILYGRTQKGSTGRSDFWESRFSTEVLSILTRSQSLRQNDVLKALRIKRPPRDRRRRRRHISQRDIMKATKAAVAFAMSPTISSRTSLRLISQCIDYLRSSRHTVIPTAALRALLHNITRDLAEGKPGRTTRLQWFLYLLHTQASQHKTYRMGLALEQWRAINKRRLRQGAR
ncbi:hypothetical protein M426DRAFT_9471 [Hypoxylon sp. CI-4A]|nr:hypothetical protein M426DRAFT_9471 [Hypoxylon sp. CI-4A]